MFNRAHNTTIHGGTFVNNERAVLDPIHSRVATNAILNAGGRADEVRCHPGTRKEVIDCIEKWREDAQSGVKDVRMFWLSGPAGAGKTAIVQTIAESWASRGIHAANFFFFRSDPSRNHVHSLVSTLLYQIFDIYPATRDAVEKTLASKPRILDASIKDQFDQLICSPLRTVGSPFSQPIVLLIDGLDECDPEEKASQGQILRALDTLLTHDDLPFLVLIACRLEHQITMAFKELRSTVEPIFLDEKFAPEKDIHLFVTAEFKRIKRGHPLAPSDENWPTASDINEIVAKSSRQFIYAATVMRFILQSPAHPKLSLAKVQGTARIATKSPFTHLDAMYTYILSQVDDLPALKVILCARTICARLHVWGVVPVQRLRKVLSYYNNSIYTSDCISSCFADIPAIARLQNGVVTFYHSSLDDYLRDQSRSGQFHLDICAFVIKILPKAWEDAGTAHRLHDLVEVCIAILSQDIDSTSTPTPDLWDALYAIKPAYYVSAMLDYLVMMHNRCTSEIDATNYRQIIGRWTTYYFGLVLVGYSEAEVYTTTLQRLLSIESAFNIYQTVLRVQTLLWDLDEKFSQEDPERCQCLLNEWIPWALSNGVKVIREEEAMRL